MTELLLAQTGAEHTIPDADQVLTDDLIHRAQEQADALQEGGASSREAIDTVFTTVLPVIEGVVKKYERNPLNAEEIVSGALAKVIRRGIFERKYDGGNYFPAWAGRVAANFMRDEWRRNQRHNPDNNGFSLEDELTALVADKQYATPSPEDEVIEQDRVERMYGLLQESGLSQAHVDAVMLHAFGKSQEEIAEITGAPIGTIKSRISRGYDTIRRHYGITKDTTRSYDLLAEVAPVAIKPAE